MATPKTIVLRGKGIRKEAIADTGSSIVPGDLLERDNATEVSEHSGAGLNAVAMFAVENEVVGKGIDDVYAAGDNVLFEILPPGCEVYARLAASAAAIVAGDYLESDGLGGVRKAVADAATDTAQREAIIAQALEDVDNSAGPAGTRIRIEIV